MNEEEFITKFYSCDDEEQFLKDVYHNLNCLQQENQQLKIQVSARKEVANKYKEVINEAIIYLKYYLMDNMRFKDSQAEFKKILRILDKGADS